MLPRGRDENEVSVLEKTRQVIRSLSIRLALRILLGVALILVGIVLLFLPGQGLLLIFLGLVVLGFTVDDIVDVCRKVIPGFDEKKAQFILNHRYLQRFRRKKWVSLHRKGGEQAETNDESADS